MDQYLQDFYVRNYLRPRASLVTHMVKCLTAMWETRVQSLGWEDPLEKEMATHSSTLAWKIPRTEEPGRLQSKGVTKRWTRLSDFTSPKTKDRPIPNELRKKYLAPIYDAYSHEATQKKFIKSQGIEQSTKMGLASAVMNNPSQIECGSIPI